MVKHTHQFVRGVLTTCRKCGRDVLRIPCDEGEAQFGLVTNRCPKGGEHEPEPCGEFVTIV